MAISSCAKSSFFLKSWKLEIIAITLMMIFSITGNKMVKCLYKSLFTYFISKIVSFKILYKSILCFNLEVIKLSTIIHWLSRHKFMTSCMCNDLIFTSSSISSCIISRIMITLDMENKISFTMLHFIVKSWVIWKFLQIKYIFSYST